jgi:hypothetical protein
VRVSDAAAVVVAMIDQLWLERAFAPFQRGSGDLVQEAERLMACWQVEPEVSQLLPPVATG